ncbi:glycine oxidase ThiO [Geodermatophilus sp. DSM 44513]|uniref:glycine oxidase ThiO n=1 Tax=Geodermatophilus sp. DSM 44513 TaxID=1528104 RepID=UPI00126A90F5|nr:glycine oxidase ThiO [Geodermatophilus sp. DSM 44513]WNV75216.1 glycine oxidase ThiO [Geodermatophilus sp. DSM 44513]
MSEIVVAGGGLIGLAVAWRCAQRGLPVTVIDEAPGSGASYAAAGMLAPVSEVTYGEEALLALCQASLQRFPAFVTDVQAASGIDVGLRTAGTVVVGFDTDDMRALQDLHAYQDELGLAVERLTPRQVRRREPSLTPRLRGGLAVAGDHSVDGRSLHAALLAAAQAAGVRIRRARIAALGVTGGRVTGLQLADGAEVRGDTVVAALGARTGALPGMPAVGVRPVKGQILRLRGAAGLLAGTVRALVRGRQVYLVPYAEDRLVVGATVEDRGFDATVTVGAVHDLLRDAIEVVPAVSELELVEVLARWRPGTSDNAPLLGPTELPGLVLATGHYRNGVLLTPVTAEVITDLLISGRLPQLAVPFTPHRASLRPPDRTPAAQASGGDHSCS